MIIIPSLGEDQPDLQAVEPADLQRHHLLPLLHVALRTARSAGMKGFGLIWI